MEFSRQKYWSGLPFSTPGNLSYRGISLTSLASPALASRFFTIAPPGMSQISVSAENNKCCWGCGAKGVLAQSVGMEIDAATMVNSIKVPQKIKNRTTIWSSNSTPGYLSEENAHTKFEKTHAPQCSQQHHLGKQPEYPSAEEWMQTMAHTDTTEYYSAVKTTGLCHLQGCRWTWGAVWSAKSASQRKTNTACYHRTENLKHKTHQRIRQIRNWLTDRAN